MSDNKKAQGFYNQVILYAKGWYGKSGKGIITDLRLLLARYSGTHLRYISERDAWESLCFAFGQYATRVDIQEALFETVGGKWKGLDIERNPEEVLVGKLSACKGEYVDMDEKMDYSLGYQVDMDEKMGYSLGYQNN